MMQMFNRLFAVVLVLCMAAGLMLMPAAFAAEDEVTTDPTETTAPVEEAAPNDPYVFVYRPSSDIIPEYYDFYSRPYWAMPPHRVYNAARDDSFDVAMFNLVNTSMLIEDEAQAPAGGYASVTTLCSDCTVSAVAETSYRLLNLEDGYFCIKEDGSVDPSVARHIRAVMSNTLPGVGAAQIETAANAYLTATYGEDAVLITDLTGAELVSASQAAVWHFANGIDFLNDPYAGSDDFDSLSELWQDYYTALVMYMDDPVNIRELPTDNTASNIAGVFEYLVNLPEQYGRDIVITDDAVMLESMWKVGDDDSFDLTVVIGIYGTVNSDDQITMTASFGGQTLTYKLGSNNELSPNSEGLYTITFTGLNEADCADSQLSVEVGGVQTVSDIYFYEPKPGEGLTAREISQNMVGAASTSTPVRCTGTFEIDVSRTLEICKIDASSGEALPGVSFDLYVNKDGKETKLDTYTTDESGVISVDLADDGYEYYFVETNPLPGYSALDGSIVGGTVENEYIFGSLEVSKEVVNPSAAQDWEYFNFTVTLDLTDAPLMDNGFEWLNEEYVASLLESSKELTWAVSGENQITAAFTLHADESITIDGIPVGAVYTVEEVLTDEDRIAFSVTTTVTAGDGTAVEGNDNAVSGTVAEVNAVLYTNEFFEIEETTVPETTIPVKAEDETKASEATVPKDTTNPSTGDHNTTAVMAVCILSAVMTFALFLTKRRWV